MFSVFYSDGYDTDEKISKTTFDDKFGVEFKKYNDIVDNFIYMNDMFKIISSCAEDLNNYNLTDNSRFWVINKYLMSYVNAIYVFKEHLSAINKNLQETYRKEKAWYRFVCDYRNKVIHQFAIITDYNSKTHDKLIDLKELENLIDKNKDIKLYERINELKDSAIVDHEQCFIGLKVILEKVNDDVRSMKQEVLEKYFDDDLLPSVEWFLKHIVRDDKYHYTIIYRDYDELNCCPNDVVEGICEYIRSEYDGENAIRKKMEAFLQKENYTQFYV